MRGVYSLELYKMSFYKPEMKVSGAGASEYHKTPRKHLSVYTLILKIHTVVNKVISPSVLFPNTNV